LSFGLVPIQRPIESSLRAVQESLETGQVSVQVNVAEHLPPVMADEGNLIRALENLYRNAIDAMPGGGTICIRAARDTSPEPRLRLEVEDTGRGIAKEHLPRIFRSLFHD
jgi:signal transduction histidine kinase